MLVLVAHFPPSTCIFGATILKRPLSIIFLALDLTFLMIDFLQFPAALAYSITGVVLLLLCLAMVIKGYHSISQGQSAKDDEVIAVSDTKSDVL
jgi:hypothetical protein